jgi:hypothetical protein
MITIPGSTGLSDGQARPRVCDLGTAGGDHEHGMYAFYRAGQPAREQVGRVRDRRPRPGAAGAGGLAKPPRWQDPAVRAFHAPWRRTARWCATTSRAAGCQPVAGPSGNRPGGAASSRRPCGKVDFLAHAWDYACSRPPRWPRRRPRRPSRESVRARSTRIQRLTSASSAGVVCAGTASCSASSRPLGGGLQGCHYGSLSRAKVMPGR